MLLVIANSSNRDNQSTQREQWAHVVRAHKAEQEREAKDWEGRSPKGWHRLPDREKDTGESIEGVTAKPNHDTSSGRESLVAMGRPPFW